MVDRIRVLTPEALDAKAAALVSTPGTSLRSAVQSAAGSSGAGATGVSTATPNTVIQRDANARAQVAAPSASSDIATKGYVDSTAGSGIPTSQKGSANGVATLDSSSILTSTQVPTTLGRSLGTGTSLPGSPRRGDVFYHTGINCLLSYDGSEWAQQGRCKVASRAARDALVTSYSSVLHNGFLVEQTNKNYLWRMCNDGVWSFAGWVGGTPFGNVDGPIFAYRKTNTLISSQVDLILTRVSGWSAEQSVGSSREWVSVGGGGIITLQDRCHIDISAIVDSNSVQRAGLARALLDVPGGTNAIGGGQLIDIRQRNGTGTGTSYAGAGAATASLAYSGPADVGSTTALWIHQYNPSDIQIAYNAYISLTISPL